MGNGFARLLGKVASKGEAIAHNDLHGWERATPIARHDS
jgi:hypothetical protein